MAPPLHTVLHKYHVAPLWHAVLHMYPSHAHVYARVCMRTHGAHVSARTERICVSNIKPGPRTSWAHHPFAGRQHVRGCGGHGTCCDTHTCTGVRRPRHMLRHTHLAASLRRRACFVVVVPSNSTPRHRVRKTHRRTLRDITRAAAGRNTQPLAWGTRDTPLIAAEKCGCSPCGVAVHTGVTGCTLPTSFVRLWLTSHHIHSCERAASPPGLCACVPRHNKPRAPCCMT